MALFCLAQGARAQNLNFDTPLSVTQVVLPLNHPVVDEVCGYAPGHGIEFRYWEKNPANDGQFQVHLKPGQVEPSCDNLFPPNPSPFIVTCSVYRGFVVKERHTEDQMGDDSIAIIPRQPGQTVFSCADNIAPGEFPLGNADWMTGADFWGAVNGYVFLTSADDDVFGADVIGVFRADNPHPITELWLSFHDRRNHFTRVPGGFDLRFMAEQERADQRDPGQDADCTVAGSAGAACLAQLERAAGSHIPLAQCLKAEPRDVPQDPVALEYSALLSVRGTKATLRAAGPAESCIASE